MQQSASLAQPLEPMFVQRFSTVAGVYPAAGVARMVKGRAGRVSEARRERDCDVGSFLTGTHEGSDDGGRPHFGIVRRRCFLFFDVIDCTGQCMDIGKQMIELGLDCC